MLELYNAPISTCSQKVRMSLAEKQLDWQDHRISFGNGDHLTADYLKLNPNGVVPTLVHDGEAVIESSVINEYLEDAFPERPLRPADKLGVAKMRVWRQYIDEVPTPSIRYPSFNAYFLAMFSRMSQQEFEDYAATLPLRRDFYLKMGRTGFSKEEMDAALRRLRQTLERVEASLEQTEWLAADMFTLADVSIMPSIVRMEDLGLAHMWADLPQVTDWYRRLQARPAFATTYYEGTRKIDSTC